MEVKPIDAVRTPHQDEKKNWLHTDVVKQGVNGYMGEDEKWSSVCEDGTDFNGDVVTEKFFGI